MIYGWSDWIINGNWLGLGKRFLELKVSGWRKLLILISFCLFLGKFESFIVWGEFLIWVGSGIVLGGGRIWFLGMLCRLVIMILVDVVNGK